MKAILSLLAVVVAVGAPTAEAAKTVKKRILMTYQTKGIRTDHLDLYGAKEKYAVQMQRNLKWALRSLPGSTTKNIGAVVIAGKVTARGSDQAVGVRAAKAERKVLMVNMSQYLNRQDINQALRRDIYNATRVNQMIVSTRNFHKTVTPYKVLAARVKKLDLKRRFSGEPGEPGPINATEAEATAPIDGTGPIDSSTVVSVPADGAVADTNADGAVAITPDNLGAGSGSVDQKAPLPELPSDSGQDPAPPSDLESQDPVQTKDNKFLD